VVDVGLDAVNVQGVELEGGRHGDEGAQGEEQPRVAQHDCDDGGGVKWESEGKGEGEGEESRSGGKATGQGSVVSAGFY
jgi:hypothetical protein